MAPARKFALIFLFFALLSIPSCSRNKEHTYKKSRIAMDTLVSITVASDSEKGAEEAVDDAFQEIAKLDKLLNFFSDDSEVATINRSAGERPVVVSEETLDVIDGALYVADKTGGAFDITIGAVSPLWDFRGQVVPGENVLREKLKLVGYKNITLDRVKSTVFLKKKGMKIDLGGIAKGFAADRAGKALKKRGIKSGIVAVAGDIRAFGRRPDGKAWNIGLKNPRASNEKDEIFAVMGLSDRAISTSGDYERFFMRDGVRYHHLLDPKTGRPSDSCRAVSVITKEGAYADAFSTAVFVLGPEKGMEILNKLGFDGVITDRDGKLHITEGIKNEIELRNKP